MADSKITALTSISTSTDPANDPLVIVDVSDTSMAATGTAKKVTLNQLLGASGTATLASATITGDLTVGTGAFGAGQSGGLIGNGKQVVFTNNSGSNSGWISNADNACIYSSGAGGAFAFNGHLVLQPRGSAAGAILFGTGNGAGAMSERYRIASDGVATWSNVGGVAGTAMTLNSTGLGVGVAPSARLHVKSTNGLLINESTGDVTGAGTTFLSLVDANGQAGYYGFAGDGSSSLSVWNKKSGSLLFATGNTLRATIDSSGNVGIGVTPSAWVTFKALELGELGGAIAAGGNNTAVLYNAYFNSGFKYARSGVASSYYQQTLGAHAWYTAPSGTAGNAITFTQAMTLDASGRLLLGTTSAIGKVSISYAYPSTGIGLTTDSNSTQTAIQFNTPAGLAGYINTSTTTTTYNSVSDYRLKESVQPMVGGLARVSAMKPSIYKWKADGSNGEGFIAHELAEVVPAAVSGEKDAVNEDGSIKAQGVDLSKVVPVLVAAIQELTARVQTLETR